MGFFTALLIISNILSGNVADDSDAPPTKLVQEVSDVNDRSEILWLARIIYSETKVSEEMKLIAWVARNRKDTAYRGDKTYESVAKSKNQFSGLNTYDPEYKNNVSLEYSDTANKSWNKALEIAEEVYYANEPKRPFPITVRHFYSPKSVTKTPSWAENSELYYSVPGEYGEPLRFAFYNGVK